MVSRRRAYNLVLFAVCHLFNLCHAIQYEPWLGNYLEFEWRHSFLYQSYPVVAIDSGLKNYSSDDFFLKESLSNTLAPNFGIELEVTGAETRRQSWDVDNFKIAGRYVFLDDIAGDPISLTGGFVLTQAFQPSLHDISSFHHGISEAELFVSVGKERALRDDWQNRWWGVVGVGCAADRGSPWVRGDVVYEMRLGEDRALRLLINSLWGCGDRRLHIHHFHGYGSVKHQSIDMGFRYTKLLEFVGDLEIEYTYRVYARNFPANAHRVMLTFLYTFGFGCK